MIKLFYQNQVLPRSLLHHSQRALTQRLHHTRLQRLQADAAEAQVQPSEDREVWRTEA